MSVLLQICAGKRERQHVSHHVLPAASERHADASEGRARTVALTASHPGGSSSSSQVCVDTQTHRTRKTVSVWRLVVGTHALLERDLGGSRRTLGVHSVLKFMPSTSVTASAQPPEQSVELWKIICGTSPTHPREEERDTWGPSMDMSMQPESPNQALLFIDPNAVPVHPVSEPA